MVRLGALSYGVEETRRKWDSRGCGLRAARAAPASLAEQVLELQTTTRAALTRAKQGKARSTGG